MVSTPTRNPTLFAGRDLLRTLGGSSAFVGNSHGELIVAHMMHQPQPLAERVEPGTSDALVQLVMRMLLKDKEARPTMRQVVAELDRMGGYMSGCSARSRLGQVCRAFPVSWGWSCSRPGPARCRAQARCRAGVPQSAGQRWRPVPQPAWADRHEHGLSAGAASSGSLPGQAPPPGVPSTLAGERLNFRLARAADRRRPGQLLERLVLAWCWSFWSPSDHPAAEPCRRSSWRRSAKLEDGPPGQ